ncbi:MAG: site-2 protease family protein [Oscillospiraceae bacterium]|nr:site-2 protease family protein [Oscillospiraceae bacterium]
MPLFQLNIDLLTTWGVRVAVLLVCLPIHEFAHGYAAYKRGDHTAARQGRLTLNPFVHLDLFGSAVLLFAGFGWAKPVPVNAAALPNPRRDMAIIAFAGPLANLIMAFIMLCVVKVVAYTADSLTFMTPQMLEGFFFLLQNMLFINLALAVFNLLPIPPLDGSKILGALLPEPVYFTMLRYERVVLFFLIFLMFTGRLGNIIWTLAGRMLSVLHFLTRPIDILFGG